ncbi:MAG: hypothetical protein ACK4NP_15095 [Parvularculaceae bacterium]
MKRRASDILAYALILYLSVGAWNWFFGPRGSADEAICAHAKGYSIDRNALYRILFWPIDLFGPPPASCLYPGRPAQMR